MPLLLEWANSPPPGINGRELYFGLFEAFGRLRAQEAIPFLVTHINFRGILGPNFALKAPEVNIDRLPAVRALLQIGPEAIPALGQAYFEPMSPTQRQAILFTLIQMNDPRIRSFLVEARHVALEDLRLAEEGLATLDEKAREPKSQ